MTKQKTMNLLINRAILLLASTFIFFSCSNFNIKRIEEFSQKEVNSGIEKIENILEQYGVTGANVYGTAHLRYGVGEISRHLYSESVTGKSLDMQGPPDMEGSIPPGYLKSIAPPVSYYENLQLKVEYDTGASTTIYCDYLSFFVMIDKQYKDMVPELDDALSNFILNKYRGDVLTIIVSN